MRLQRAQHDASAHNYMKDLVHGQDASTLLDEPFEVWQASQRIFVQDHDALPGNGHTQTEFRLARRRRTDGTTMDVYVYNDNGIPCDYFVEVT